MDLKINNFKNNEKYYDFILIFSSLQRNCFYATIVRYLSSDYKIAIYVTERLGNVKRIEKSNQNFLTYCKKIGATILKDENAHCKIDIITQANFSEEEIKSLNSKIYSQKSFLYIGVAMGNAYIKNLFSKKIEKFLVPDLAFYQYRLKVYGDNGVHIPLSEIKEVGMPYKKYPFIEKQIQIDFLIATPTPFSFKFVKDRLDYIQNLCSLIKKIGDTSKVYYKPHNADERVDYIVNKRFLFLINLPVINKFKEFLYNFSQILLKKTKNQMLENFLSEICIAILYQKIMKNIKHLSEISEFHFLNLEIFLPFVSKGLITGRSNSIWHGLYSNLPVYNCVDKDKEYYSEVKMHKYSMKYFNIHENYKKLNFKQTYFNMISNKTRNADIISFLKDEIKK